MEGCVVTGFGGEAEQCVCLRERRQGTHAGRELSQIAGEDRTETRFAEVVFDRRA